MPRKSQRIETFEQALQRLNLTEADLQQRIKEFSVLVKCFSGLCLLLLAYIIYLLIQHVWWPAVGSTGILLIMFAHLFRYHFWLFQIRQRKLGCQLREWFFNLNGAK